MTRDGHEPLSISIVMPAHNEELTIERAISESLAELRKVGERYEVIVVDDASTDSTRERADAIAALQRQVRVIVSETNIGANSAALLGMRQAIGDVIFFIPADLQIPPSQLRACLPALAGADYICTWRRPRADPLHRRLMAGGYNAAVRLLFRLPTHDIDSAILVRREVILKIAPKVTSSSDFIPVEMALRAASGGFRLAEVAIEHHPRSAGSPSAIIPREVARTLGDMVRLVGRLRRLRGELARESDGIPTPEHRHRTG